MINISAFTLGLMDGLTVPIGVASGLLASGKSRAVIMTAIISEGIAGATSMGLSNYLSVESTNTSDPRSAGLWTAVGYLMGATIPLLAYLLTTNVNHGFALSIVLNIISLIIFGYWRRSVTNIKSSVNQVLLIGGISMMLTYAVGKLLLT